MRTLILGFLIAAASSLLASDWPMLGHDPQRSGSTIEEIRGPLARKWYRSFHEEGLACGVQPVIAKGLVYVGTMHGDLHAIDAATGQDRWSFQAGGGILHSAAMSDGTCYFTALDGKLYALDAATGRSRWTFKTGQALWNAPVVADGKVFFGGRDGFFYAVKADGTLAWKTPVGGPILCSPAFDGGAVFVAGEDMVAYCFDADSGTVMWTNRVYGISCRAYHPVIAGDYVIFTTQPGLGKFGPVDVLLEASEKLGLRPRRRIGADPRGKEETKEEIAAKDEHNRPLLMDPAILKNQLELVREIHRERPHTRTFFAFDKRTGKEPWIAPICWEESCGGPGNPPVVLSDGRVVVKYALFTQARHNDYARYIRAGYLDLKTGDITPMLDPLDRQKGPPWGLVHDEMARLTGSGQVLLHARMGYPGYRGVVGMDLATLRTETLADNIHYGEESIGPMNLLRLVKGEEIPPALEYLTRGAGVFGGTGTYAAVSVADGTIYYIPGHEGRVNGMLIAWSTDKAAKPGWRDPGDAKLRDDNYRTPENMTVIRNQPLDWDMLVRPYGRCWPRDPRVISPEDSEVFTARQREARQYATSVARDALENYIWETPRMEVSSAPEELRRRVRESAQEIVDAKWRPLHFPDLMFGGIYFYHDPTDVFHTLAVAWPLLDLGMQQRVKTYLRREFTEHDPLAAKTLDPKQGVPRTDYTMPILDARRWDSRLPGLRRLYPLWEWANAAGEWELLRSPWTNNIRALLDEAKPATDAGDTLWQNDLISGVIAYARFARRFGDSDAEKRAADKGVELLRQRIEAERTYTQTRFHQRLLLRSQPTRYLFLSPELGRLVNDHALDAAKELYARYVTHHRPTWFMAWGPLTYDAWETSIDRPNNSWAVFTARALIFNDPGDALARCLDLPWCKADLYYLDKLSLTAMAYRKPGWRDFRVD